MSTFCIGNHYNCFQYPSPLKRSYSTKSLSQRRSLGQSFSRFGSSPLGIDSLKWRRKGFLVRAEEEKNGSFTSTDKADEQYQELMQRSRTCDPLCSADDVSVGEKPS